MKKKMIFKIGINSCEIPPEIQPLSAAEASRFLEAARRHAPHCYPLFLAALHTGLRSGELAALQWGDIDFASRCLTVRRQIVGGRVVPFTKSGRIRRVPLRAALGDVLKALSRPGPSATAREALPTCTA